jgi:hypothetical protein
MVGKTDQRFQFFAAGVATQSRNAVPMFAGFWRIN